MPLMSLISREIMQDVSAYRFYLRNNQLRPSTRSDPESLSLYIRIHWSCFLSHGLQELLRVRTPLAELKTTSGQIRPFHSLLKRIYAAEIVINIVVFNYSHHYAAASNCPANSFTISFFMSCLEHGELIDPKVASSWCMYTTVDYSDGSSRNRNLCASFSSSFRSGVPYQTKLLLSRIVNDVQRNVSQLAAIQR